MKHQILFVDDDQKLLKSFKRILSEQFRVVTAEGPGRRVAHSSRTRPISSDCVRHEDARHERH